MPVAHNTCRFPFMVMRNMVVVNFSITRTQLSELLITATMRAEMAELEHEHVLLMRHKVRLCRGAALRGRLVVGEAGREGR